MKEKYDVFFELFGKKMKTTIIAKSEEEAKYILMSKIIFHKIETQKSNNNSIDFLKHIFGI